MIWFGANNRHLLDGPMKMKLLKIAIAIDGESYPKGLH